MPHSIHTLDLHFQDHSELIASFLVPCPEGGHVLFESGPASTLATLEAETRRAGFEPGDLKAVFLTHVHLDHAAGAGSLARRWDVPVFVHPLGSRHLIDPQEKLVPSAERIYGDMMVPLWGNIEAVPETQIREVADGETVVVAGLETTAHHTPGHAVHHIAWRIGRSVVTGDIGGVRFPGATHVLPPMPPPDIDVAEWRESLDLLLTLEPDRLLLTHFGAFTDVRSHLRELDGRLGRWLEIAARTLAEGDSGKTIATEILALDEAEMAAAEVGADAEHRYRTLCPMDGNSAGLARYCRHLAGS